MDNSTEIRTGYVYGLFDSRLPVELANCRYIGKTVQKLNRRLTGHNCDAKKPSHRRVCRWINKIINEGGLLVIQAFETHSAPDDKQLNALLSERETVWIAEGRRQGWDLTNHTDGGDGMVGNVRSSETRAKISAGNMGHPSYERTPEIRARISASLSGRKRTPEAIEKTASALRGKPGKPMSDETKEKLRIANTGRVTSDETKAKLSEIFSGREFTPEWRAKISAANTGRKHTPESRANMSAAKMGNTSRKGTKTSDEARANLSASKLGKKRGPYKKRVKP